MPLSWKLPQQQALKDPRLDLIRSPFLTELHRLLLCLSLAQFSSVPPLYFLFAHTFESAVFTHYVYMLTGSGFFLMFLAFLCRYKHIRSFIAYLCFGLLFAEVTYVFFREGTFVPFVRALLPILCFIAPPIFGRRSSYWVGALSFAVLIFHHGYHHGLPQSWQEMSVLSPVLLLVILIVFSAYLADLLWTGLLSRESKLREALKEVESKAIQMRSWIEKLTQASSQINAGRTIHLPDPPPYQVFTKLTDNLDQMQQKLQTYFANQLLKDRLSSIGVLAAGVAHELNTPLTTLHFLVESEETLSQESKKTLVEELDRMTQITRGLLSFGSQGTKESLDLNEVVRAAEPFLRRCLTSETQLTFELADEVLPFSGTASEVQQIILNISENSIDATEKTLKPTLTISTKQLNHSSAQLTIEDNGTGIETEDLQKILDPFFTTKSPGKGTGLGLFLVHQILEKHHAQLSIDSTQGKGTKVIIQFPLANRCKLSQEAA